MKIGIVSLGLIGGSLFKALVDSDYDVCAVTRNKDTINFLKNNKYIVSDCLMDLSCCDVVFVCSPMNKTLEVLDALESVVSSDTIVVDVCSLKKFLFQKKRPYVFIGTHPMAGTEFSGFDASFKELFIGAKWVITAEDGCSSLVIDVLSNILKSIGAIPVSASADEHDKAVALISHMPLILSQALVCLAEKDSLAMRLAASGFRDMTRLALSNTEMANDMLNINRENIRDSLELLKVSIERILDSDYLVMSERIKKIRSDLYNESGKNNYD